MATTPRVAILVSQHLHCLADILYRRQAGELRCTVPLIIGNHPDAARPLARYHERRFSSLRYSPE